MIMIILIKIKMNNCIQDHCIEERTHSGYCEKHFHEIKTQRKIKKAELVAFRMNDPFYIQDSLLYTKCIDTLIPINDDDEDKFWLDQNMHVLLFDEYYKQDLSRTNLLIQKVKKLHRNCCKLKNGIEMLEYELNEYQRHEKFLVKWIEESKIIEKSKLVKELPLITDVKTIVQHIITKL